MDETLALWKKLAASLKKRDPALKPIIETAGWPQVEFRKDKFRALARSILSQQLATAAARTIIGRFAALSPPFPKPAAILRFKLEELRAAGVSAQKASYLIALSEKWQEKSWRTGWEKLSDEALIERLVEVKGVGEWTAHMFLMFNLGRPDVLPIGDFGVRRGIQLLRGLPEMPLPKDVAALVPQWEGAASIGAWYMWRALDGKLFE